EISASLSRSASRASSHFEVFVDSSNRRPFTYQRIHQTPPRLRIWPIVHNPLSQNSIGRPSNQSADTDTDAYLLAKIRMLRSLSGVPSRIASALTCVFLSDRNDRSLRSRSVAFRIPMTWSRRGPPIESQTL